MGSYEFHLRFEAEDQDEAERVAARAIRSYCHRWWHLFSRCRRLKVRKAGKGESLHYWQAPKGCRRPTYAIRGPYETGEYESL